MYNTLLAANGQTSVVIFPLDDPGPTRVPLLSIPPAITLYVTPQCSELTVIIAILPVTTINMLMNSFGLAYKWSIIHMPLYLLQCYYKPTRTSTPLLTFVQRNILCLSRAKNCVHGQPKMLPLLISFFYLL